MFAVCGKLGKVGFKSISAQNISYMLLASTAKAVEGMIRLDEGILCGARTGGGRRGSGGKILI